MSSDDNHDGENDGESLFQHNNQYNFDGKIMLTAVISLFVVLVLFILLHIYAKYVLRRQARRRAGARPVSVALRMMQVQSHEPPKMGLDPLVIASLPIFVYKQMERLDKIECSVCLSTLEEEEMARLLPNCKHMFHAECIDMWLSSNLTCPVCRTEAEPRRQAEGSKSIAGVLPSTAPPLDTVKSILTSLEGTSDGAAQFAKVGGSSSQLSSFRRMLSRDRSSRRIQPCGEEDLERQ
ncbi:hypothetical protein HHK36_003559 [Tetracentron sinense]|uniref:RING-type E3 ubiquitin transferase n=1 Tax=Tetracentron sinense TaxID=13715 RepID=A0A834ZP97_TETSI|nr:hypothetical protein HHK36_003559 [Tetracentron sinense]